MDSDDEFNQFVMDEIIDSSSSDDERKAIISGAAHLIVEDTLNHPGRIGSVEGHDVVDRERLLHHDLLYKDNLVNRTKPSKPVPNHGLLACSLRKKGMQEYL